MSVDTRSSSYFGRMAFTPPSELPLHFQEATLRRVELEVFEPGQKDSWPQRLERIAALKAERETPRHLLGEIIRDEPASSTQPRILVYQGNYSNYDKRFLVRMEDGPSLLWMYINAGHVLEPEARTALLEVARAWRPAGQETRGGFWVPGSSIALPVGESEEASQVWETPRNRDKKKAPEQERVRIELSQTFPPEPGPGLLERLGQGLAALAGVFTGELSTPRRRARTLAGLDGEEVAMVTIEEKRKRLFCAWTFPGSSGRRAFPAIQLQLQLDGLGDETAGLKRWDQMLESLCPAP